MQVSQAPANSRWRRWFIIFGVWTAYGLVAAVQSHYRMVLVGRELSWRDALLAELSYTWLWALVTPIILWLGHKYPFRARDWARALAVHLPAALFFTVVTKFVWDVGVVPSVLHRDAPTEPVKWLLSVLWSLDYGLLQYTLVVLTQHMLSSLRRSEEDRLRATRLEAELARAQLSALKMQLHPHFLFNTLHAVTELVHQEPDKAERMVVRLSDLLRYTIDQFGVHEVTLSQELDFLKGYLDIEKIRFEDRLQVEYDIDPATLGAQVPNFLLQPLVENALRHGIEAQNKPGILRIESHVQGETLAMQIIDTGPGLRPGTEPNEGVGLGNTRRRLERLFGADQRLRMMNVKSGGFSVTVEIPLRLTA